MASWIFQPPKNEKQFKQFVSDPSNPVPYRKRSDITLRFTPRPYMSDDQRFASKRDDVLVFQSQVLREDLTLVGPVNAHLKVSTDQSAADWIVKLIDVYPESTPNDPSTPEGITLAGYQQMVRSEVIRGRFRNSYSKPEPFQPNQVTPVKVPLQDVFHTFKKGHRVMIHVQSSWFHLGSIATRKLTSTTSSRPKRKILSKQRIGSTWTKKIRVYLEVMILR